MVLTQSCGDIKNPRRFKSSKGFFSVIGEKWKIDLLKKIFIIFMKYKHYAWNNQSNRDNKTHNKKHENSLTYCVFLINFIALLNTNSHLMIYNKNGLNYEFCHHSNSILLPLLSTQQQLSNYTHIQPYQRINEILIPLG